MKVHMDEAGWIHIPPEAWAKLEAEHPRPETILRTGMGLLARHRVYEFDTIQSVGRVVYGASPKLYGEWEQWAWELNRHFTPERCEQCWQRFATDGTKLGIGWFITLVRRVAGEARFPRGVAP